MSRRQFSRAYLRISLAVIAAMGILPANGWLVRQQLRVLCAGAPFPGIEEPHSRAAIQLRTAEESAAAAKRDDFELQIASALRRAEAAGGDDGSSDGSDGKPGADGLRSASVRALLQLRARFGNPPELDAAILRFLSRGDLCLNRPEESILYLPQPAKQEKDGPQAYRYEPSTTMSSPAAIRLAEDAAVRGETGEPTNAFFPTMLAAALLAESRDKAALIALRRAAGLPGWNDHASDEARARVALLVAANGGEPGGFSRAVTAQSVTLTHLPVLRRLAYVGTALAVQREIDGDSEGGFEIRQSIARIGAKLLEGSEYSICASRGADMLFVAAGRPGGSAALEERSNEKDSYDAEIEAHYIAYLDRSGHSEEAAWFTGERARADRIRLILKIGDDRSNLGLADCYYLAYWWAAGLFTMINAVAVLMFGGLSVLFARSPRVKSGLPLHAGIRCGLIVALLVPICAFVSPMLLGESSSESVPNEIVGFGIATLALVLFGLKRKETWRGFARNVAVFFAAVTTTLGILAALAWLGAGLMTPLSALTNFCSSRFFGLSWEYLGAESMFAAMALVIPAILMLVLAVQSRVKRIPVSARVVRGMHSAALPTAATLLFVYAVVCCGTLAQDATTRRHMDDRSRLGDGRADAQRIGAEWPVPTDKR